MTSNPVAALEQAMAEAVDRTEDVPVDDLLAALVALRRLRARLDGWERQLIAGARDAGASWAELAPALGVASRQAAERRFLRLAPGDDAEPSTRDQRVQVVRDRRAADRAVDDWARTQGADLRQLAGLLSALEDLGPAAQPSLDNLYRAIGTDDAAALVPLLAEAARHLPAGHALASRLAGVAAHADEIRESTRRQRAHDR
ncbi:hypothetical protein O7635_32930 [Asanoa sp. WMMD1127]|uniref:hypothetical protein n=1 Tax=Asanoa sp. WMMD1127 TaxID=3016107 RepID=UPI002416F829|nr:hypothetical protein [Asanoa sp. WMMD1127]MDG4826679.1 hypothetical protein [Asanoa sp. WMMD1127]